MSDRQFFDHFTGDLVTQDQTGLGSGAAAHHVLVGAADVAGDYAQDDAVLDLPAARVLHVSTLLVMTSSRASPLPHSAAFQSWNSVECGSGIAREGVHQSTTVRLAFKNTRRSM